VPKHQGLPKLARGHQAWLKTGILVLATCGLSIAVRWPYFHCYFAGDDMNFLAEIGLARCGRLSWVAGWSTVIGPHAMLLWKPLFSLQWFLFGLDPFKFHLASAVVHGLTGTVLFALCRIGGLGLFGAWTTALCWSAAAIGGWDNPSVWLVAGGICVALLLFFAAMWFAAQVDRHGRAVGSALAMASFYALSMLLWSDFALLSPVLLVELSWRGLWRQSARRILLWLNAWLLPPVFIVPLLGWLIAGEVRSASRAQHVDIIQAAVRTSGQMAVGLGTLTYGYVAAPDIVLVRCSQQPGEPSGKGAATAGPPGLALGSDEPLLPKFALAALLVVALLLFRRAIAWHILSLVALVTFLFLLAANLGGFAMSTRDAINHGHYLFFACLPWCVVFGCLANSLRFRSARSALLAGLAAAALLLLFVAHQRRVALQSAHVHDVGFRDSTRAFEQLRRLLVGLSRLASTIGQPIRLPDVPIGLEAGYYPCWPLAAFYEVAFPRKAPGLKIVAARDVLPEDLERAQALLRRFDEPPAGQLADTMSRIYPLLKAFIWLDDEVKRRGQAIALPDGRVTLPAGAMGLRQICRFQISAATTRRLQFEDVPRGWRGEGFRQRFPQLADLLRSSHREDAAFLLRLYWQSP
jgi:hypothetical protein